MSDFFKSFARPQEQSVAVANKERGKRKTFPSLWLDHYVGECELQDKGVDATTRLLVVISTMADRHKASAGIESKRRAIVHGYFKNDALSAAYTSLGAYGSQECRTDSFSPPFGQYT
jgi:hypothetical protein